MNKIVKAAVLLWLVFGLMKTSSAQVYFDPGIGVVFNDPSGLTTPRLNLGAHNLLFNRVGVFTTVEFPRASSEQLSVNPKVRDVIGGIVQVHNNFSVYAGTGVIKNGFLSNTAKVDIRKEFGVQFTIPNTSVNIDLGYSSTYGISTNIGYVIPYVKKSKIQNQENQIEIKQNQIVKQVPIPGSKQAEVIVKSDPLPKPVIRTNSLNPETESEVENKAESNSVKDAKANLGPDSENMTPGVYAVNGVFRYRRNAQIELNKLKNSGITQGRIGYRASTGMYYLWLLYSADEQEVKDYVTYNRDRGKLKTVWLLRVK